mgnify:CR=1 FL=1
MRSNTPMKIILVGPIPPYRGGIAHFTQALGEKLLQEGYEVLTISFHKQYPKWLYPGKSDKDFSQTTKLANVEFLFSPLNFLDWKKSLKTILAFQPNLVIYPWWVTFWAPATSWLLAQLRKNGIPAKVLVHNAFPHEGGLPDKSLTKFALKNARSFVTMSEKESHRLKTVVHPDSIIQTVSHPVYAQFPLSGLSQAEVRENLGVPNNKPIALFFGFVRPYKGLGVLLEALGRLKQEHIDLHLLVAGEFWQGQAEYEKRITDLDIGNMLTIRADYIPDSEAGLYFEAADFFVAPYLEGTQSGSIKIAMAYQLPLIVSDAITDPLILNYGNGLGVIKAGEVTMLADKLREFSQTHLNSDSKVDSQSDDNWQPLLDALIG